MFKTKEEFLIFLAKKVDELADEYMPEDINLKEYDIRIRFVTKKNPLGDYLRLVGNSIFIRLDTIKYDSPPLHPAGSKNRSDKFLGFDPIWVTVEHITSVAPGKDMDINGTLTKTCHVSIMEESLFRIPGTCETFFASIQDPINEYTTSSEEKPVKIEDVDTDDDALLSDLQDNEEAGC